MRNYPVTKDNNNMTNLNKDYIKFACATVLGIVFLIAAVCKNHKGPYALCPKCHEPITAMCHDTYYDEIRAISDMHEQCWASSTVIERVEYHIKFMREYGWNETDAKAVVAATLEGK